jgi:dihydroorotate dehydrogenase subfamily 1
MPIRLPKLHRIEEIIQKTPEVKVFRFYSPEIVREAKPGQFVMVWNPKVDEIPIAIANCDTKNDVLEIAISDEGDCSRNLHQKKVGDFIGLRGPFGRGYSLTGKRICMVGGGYGISSLRFAAETAKKMDKEVLVLMGAKTKDYLLYKDELEKICEVKVSTEDGSEGYKGFVTDLLLGEIEKNTIDQVLTCGPEIMMKLICEITKGKIPTQVSVERYMKCAMEICGSCDCGGYSVCKDGPVFNSEEIEKTEFGSWKRDKTGMRIPFLGSNISSIPSPIFIPKEDPLLKTQVCGIIFPNPIMNSSGTSISGKHLYRFVVNGGGGMITKSICFDRREGFNNPSVIEISPYIYQNAIGLSNQGIKDFDLEIKDAKYAKVPLITSIFGQNEPFPEEFGKVASYMKNYGADMIEINISCPHTKVSVCEEDPELVKEIVISVKKAVGKMPVFLKVSPNANYIELAKAAVEGGVDGITAINTLRYLYLDKTLNIPYMASPSGTGGKSGKEHGPLGNKIVYEIREEIDVPIAGVGGIFTGKDVVDYAMNGASLFQICSAFVTDGIEVFEKIKKEVRDYLVKNNYKNISEIVGANHKR